MQVSIRWKTQVSNTHHDGTASVPAPDAFLVAVGIPAAGLLVKQMVWVFFAWVAAGAAFAASSRQFVAAAPAGAVAGPGSGAADAAAAGTVSAPIATTNVATIVNGFFRIVVIPSGGERAKSVAGRATLPAPGHPLSAVNPPAVGKPWKERWRALPHRRPVTV